MSGAMFRWLLSSVPGQTAARSGSDGWAFSGQRVEQLPGSSRISVSGGSGSDSSRFRALAAKTNRCAGLRAGPLRAGSDLDSGQAPWSRLGGQRTAELLEAGILLTLYNAESIRANRFIR